MKTRTSAKSDTDFVPNSLSERDSSPRSLCRRGGDHKDAKLTIEKVLAIRRLYDKKIPLAEIASEFGVSKNHVCGIGKRRYWAWLAENLVPDDQEGQ